MAKKTRISVGGVPGTRGKRISTGRGWRLIHHPTNKQFVGSLLKVVMVGSERIAIVRLQKYSK
jgi:hypothetical protein